MKIQYKKLHTTCTVCSRFLMHHRTKKGGDQYSILRCLLQAQNGSWPCRASGRSWSGNKSSQCFGKSCILAEFCLYWYLWAWLSVVVVMFEAYNKSLPLSSVCVFVYSRHSARQRARVRELKVISLLVLGRHECVRGTFYINSILTLIN